MVSGSFSSVFNFVFQRRIAFYLIRQVGVVVELYVEFRYDVLCYRIDDEFRPQHPSYVVVQVLHMPSQNIQVGINIERRIKIHIITSSAVG